MDRKLKVVVRGASRKCVGRSVCLDFLLSHFQQDLELLAAVV